MDATSPQSSQASISALTGAISVKVVGVGGAGTNMVDRLVRKAVFGVEYAAINTDAQSLSGCAVSQKCLIGTRLLRGLGTGGDAELGRKCALESSEEIAALLRGQSLVFLLSGLSGGTGAGALPLVAEAAAKTGALVIAFVALPFSFEGARRRDLAQETLVEVRKHCAAVIPIPNDILLQDLDECATVTDAFSQSDLWVGRAVSSVCAMLFNKGIINLDYAHLRQAFILNGGKTLFGLGHGSGLDYVRSALNDLLMCPLLHLPESAACADSLLVNIVGGNDLSLSQVNEIMTFISEKFKSTQRTVVGAVIDPSLSQTLEICVIGTTDLVAHKPSTRRVAAAPRSEQTSAPVVAKVDAAALPLHQPKVTEHRHKKVAAKGENQEEFPFVQEEAQRGYFDNTERTIVDGQDLDVPTYLRRGIKIVL